MPSLLPLFPLPVVLCLFDRYIMIVLRPHFSAFMGASFVAKPVFFASVSFRKTRVLLVAADLQANIWVHPLSTAFRMEPITRLL